MVYFLGFTVAFAELSIADVSFPIVRHGQTSFVERFAHRFQIASLQFCRKWCQRHIFAVSISFDGLFECERRRFIEWAQLNLFLQKISAIKHKQK